jgi:hypothetical protein
MNFGSVLGSLLPNERENVLNSKYLGLTTKA